jgi:hypothetical protein
MIDRFNGLRHDTIISRHYQNNYIGDFSATGAHRRKSFVTGRI